MTALPISGAYIAVPHEHAQQECIKKTGKVVLGIHIVGDNSVIETYVRSKRMYGKRIGATVVLYRHAVTKTTEELLACIADSVSYCDGVIVQLPLPPHIHREVILNAVPITRDVDMLSDAAWNAFKLGSTNLVPPVARAVQIALESLSVPIKKKRVVIVGYGRLVGQPVSIILERMGCVVSVVDVKTNLEDRKQLLAGGEIIVTGVGKPGLLRPEDISPGVILIDGGTSEGDGTSVGDIAYECEEKASYFARVPGGIGKLTVVSLFENLLLLKESRI